MFQCAKIFCSRVYTYIDQMIVCTHGQRNKPTKGKAAQRLQISVFPPVSNSNSQISLCYDFTLQKGIDIKVSTDWAADELGLGCQVGQGRGMLLYHTQYITTRGVTEHKSHGSDHVADWI